MSMLTLSPRETWSHLRRPLISFGAIQQIVGRERRERVSQLAWCGEGCFDSRRRVNSTVRRLAPNERNSLMKRFVPLLLLMSMAAAVPSAQTLPKIDPCKVTTDTVPKIRGLHLG